MANISVTNALNDNSAISDITKVGTNFTDLVNGLTDGTKDISVNAITAAGSITANGGLTTGASGDDIYSVAWTDYSATSSITGWASFTTKEILYKKIGKTVFCSFSLVGTSNATGASFTLPYSSHATTGNERYGSAIYAKDNNVAGTGYTWTSSNSVSVGYGGLVGASWTNSGTKAIYGQIWYETAT